MCMLKRFSQNQKILNFSYKKKCYGAEILYIFSNPDFFGPNGYFQISQHPQKLVQNNNWCGMVNDLFSSFELRSVLHNYLLMTLLKLPPSLNRISLCNINTEQHRIWDNIDKWTIFLLAKILIGLKKCIKFYKQVSSDVKCHTKTIKI